MIWRIAVLALAATMLMVQAAPRKELVYRTTPQGELKIHIFYPENAGAVEKRPAIVFFFGGGFRTGSPRQFFSKARYFASRGMITASAEYRVSERHKTTPVESIEDCRAAVAWMKQNAAAHGIDPVRVAAGGGSAGGTCAMDTYFSDKPEERPSALVLFNPAIGFKGGEVVDPAKLFQGKLPSTIMFFGSNDPLLIPARAFTQTANKAGARDVRVLIAPGQGHGFFNERDTNRDWHASTTYLADRFLASLGYITGRPTISIPAGSKAILRTEGPLPPPHPVADPPGVKSVRNIVYAKRPERDLTLDLYLPALKPAAAMPLVVWVHGGAFRAGNKENPQLLYLAQRGFAVASVSYRFSQEAIFPAQTQDTKAAIRWLRAHAAEYGINPDRIGVSGDSAGGHLVAMLGTSGGVKELEDAGADPATSRVQAVVDFYGPTQLERMNDGPGAMDHDSPDSPESQLIGGVLQQNPDLARRANPATYASSDDPPTLIIHGDADPLVMLEQSEILEAALSKAKVDVTMKVIPGAGHGGPQFRTPEIQKLVEDFFAKHLKK